MLLPAVSVFLNSFLALATAFPNVQHRAVDPTTYPQFVAVTAFMEPERRGSFVVMITNNGSCLNLELQPPLRAAMTVAKSLRALMYNCKENGKCEVVEPPIEVGQPGAVLQCYLYNTDKCTYDFKGPGQSRPDQCLIEHTGPNKVPGKETKDDGHDLSTCLKHRNDDTAPCDKATQLCEMAQIKSFRCTTVFRTFTPWNPPNI